METLHSPIAPWASEKSSFNQPTLNLPTAPLNKARHIKYWLRCLKTHLPTAYQPTDSQRLSLAFFILSALDLLDALDSNTTAEERGSYIDWIYKCQHLSGGFKGSPETNDGAEREGLQNTLSDVGADTQVLKSDRETANLGSTFFALGALIVLGDDLARVRKQKCLLWLGGLQREDSSFGEAIGNNGTIEGGGDIRFCHLAASVRWILRREEGASPPSRSPDSKNVEEVNISKLVEYILRSTTYEGAIAKAPFHEAHAGETYCGIGALKLLGFLCPSNSAESIEPSSQPFWQHYADRVLRWLVSRQTSFLQEPDGELDEDEPPGVEEQQDPADGRPTAGFEVRAAHPAMEETFIEEAIQLPKEELIWAGFNGRCNKVADTCYAWWVGGTLKMLGKSHLQDFNAVERYLLDKTQHAIGGFGKLPGDPPDLLHSCLGLAALAAIRHPELKSIDPVFCISVDKMDIFERRQKAKEG